MVCQNTLTSALSANGACMRIKHTAAAFDRMQLAQRYMAGVAADAKALAAKMEALAQARLTRDSMTTIIDRLFPKPPAGQNQTRRENTVAEVLALFESNDNNAIPAIRGTGYNLLNAVTQWTDHQRSARITDDRKAAGYTVAKARAENALFGTGETLKSSALQTIIDVTSGKASSAAAAVAVMEAEDTDVNGDAEVTPDQQSRIDDIVRHYFDNLPNL